jgi:predicted DNA-binding antitoxin AbrB/MazE fold protein
MITESEEIKEKIKGHWTAKIQSNDKDYFSLYLYDNNRGELTLIKYEDGVLKPYRSIEGPYGVDNKVNNKWELFFTIYSYVGLIENVYSKSDDLVIVFSKDLSKYFDLNDLRIEFKR